MSFDVLLRNPGTSPNIDLEEETFIPWDTAELIYPTNVLEWLGRVNAAGGTVTSTQIMAVSRFISALEPLGLNNTNSRISGFVGNNLAAAMVPIFKGPGPDSDTNVGFVAGDLDPTKGIQGTLPATLAGAYILSGCYHDDFDMPDRMLSCWVVERQGLTYCGLIGCDGDGTGTGICSHGWWLNAAGTASDPYSSILYYQSTGCTGIGLSYLSDETFWVGGVSPGASPNIAIWRNGTKSADWSTDLGTETVHNEIGIMCFNRWSSTGNQYITTSDLVRGYGMGVNPTSQAYYYAAWQSLRTALS